MISYKFPNGRVMARDSKGRFRNFTLEDFGMQTNSEYLVCGKCGYGEKEKWIPILRTGKCPKCDNQKGHRGKQIVLSKRAEELIQQIEELEIKIGKQFIDPSMFNQFGGDLKRMEFELEEELRICAEQSFKNCCRSMRKEDEPIAFGEQISIFGEIT